MSRPKIGVSGLALPARMADYDYYASMDSYVNHSGDVRIGTDYGGGSEGGRPGGLSPQCPVGVQAPLASMVRVVTDARGSCSYSCVLIPIIMSITLVLFVLVAKEHCGRFLPVQKWTSLLSWCFSASVCC